LASLCALGCEPPPPSEPPLDIILISLDSVRGDAISFRDPEATPNLTELAKRGTIFSQAISGTSWTLPAHVQMMTGAPPVLHGVEDHDILIDPLMPLLAERLGEAGYFTAGFFTVGYLWGDYGFSRGFDVYESAIERHHLDLEDASHAPRGIAAPEATDEVAAGERLSSPLVRERVDRLLENLQPEEPLFLFMHFFDPHYDYIPPAPYDTRFDPDYSGTLDGRGYLGNTRIWDATANPPRRIGERDLEHLIALYRGEIAWTDQVIGEIFDRLAEVGRLERALVVVTADHGEEFFEHQRRGHRQTLYDEVLRVPLLVRPPAGAAAREVRAQVSLSDLMPTLLDYAGAETPDSVHGRSLRPAIEGSGIESRPAISTLYRSGTGKRGRLHHLLQTLRTPEEKLLRHVIVSPTGKLRVPC
jgi:arylsulfatase A-like enzyme